MNKLWLLEAFDQEETNIVVNRKQFVFSLYQNANI